MDRFYCSPDLFFTLAGKGTGACDTVHPNRKNFPKDLQPVITEVTRGMRKGRRERIEKENRERIEKKRKRKRQKGVDKTILKRRRRNLPFASTSCSASSWHCGTPPKT